MCSGKFKYSLKYSTPVSYTHLDVYKRQSLECVSTEPQPFGTFSFAEGFQADLGRGGYIYIYIYTHT